VSGHNTQFLQIREQSHTKVKKERPVLRNFLAPKTLSKDSIHYASGRIFLGSVMDLYTCQVLLSVESPHPLQSYFNPDAMQLFEQLTTDQVTCIDAPPEFQVRAGLG
jgi:hypothetical protein